MSGYRRFVAYVYEYQKGKKGNNCGFIKVEVREQRCTMEVHLHCVGLTPQVGCNVYGFVRKDGLMDGILLGSCETGEDTAECLIETDSLNMGGSGISLGRMGGMVLVTESGGFFGTEWDDQPIRPDNFREIQRKESQTAQKTRIEKKKPDLPDEEEKEQGVKTIETAPSEEDQNVNNDAGMLADEGAAEEMEAESDIETGNDFSPEIGDDEETDVEADTDAEMKEDAVNENSVAEESIQEQEENNRESGVSEDEAGEDLQGEGSDQESEIETEEETVKQRDETSRESAEPVSDGISDETDETVQEIKSSDTDIISQSMGGIEEETSILKNIQMVAENEKLLQEEQNVRIICPPDSNCGPGPRPPRPPMPPNPGPGPRPPRPPMPP
ncbi:MAG: hypothetical protein Q4D16_26070, partial [Eubacteriales bacterium]|nr:hypothetical protein [Eubacteriales bacterium]